jgi:hypothetical protein
MTQRLPSIPQRPYAASDADAQANPIYRPGNDPLPFTRNVRFAAIDVMILTFAARRHAQWLVSIGTCPEDVAELIRADLDAMARLLTPPAPAVEPVALQKPPVEPAPPQTPAIKPVPPQTPDVGPRSPRAARAKDAPTNLWDATRGDVGETGRNGPQRATVADKE